MALGFLKKALGVVASAVGIDDVGKAAVDTIKGIIGGNPELQKELAQIELEEKRLAVQEGESIRQMFAVEVKSEHRFVAYARPALLWLVIGIISTNYIILPTLNAVVAMCGGTVIAITYPELPESVQVLIGTLVTVYIGARSYDKKQKNGRRT